MLARPDLRSHASLPGLEVFQLTHGLSDGSHIYMEAQIFTPDSRRLVLHTGTDPHGHNNRSVDHQYLLCDLENKGALTPLTHENGVTGPSVSPDGQLLYYIFDESQTNAGRITLRSVRLDGTDRRTICVIDAPLPETGTRPSMLYPLSTISSDGKRFATSAFFGDGRREDAPYGVMVFDLQTGAVTVPVQGPTFCNAHLQYCRSTQSPFDHDLLIQENHGNTHDVNGRIKILASGLGADIHVVRDDGSNWRSFPWGRDGVEFCQGHQCWRGQSTWAITGTVHAAQRQEHLVESQAFAGRCEEGRSGRDPATRNELTAKHPNAHYLHFATDRAGERFITDLRMPGESLHLMLAKLGKPGAETFSEMHYVLETGSGKHKYAHVHPFLSPDGKTGFFDSDESGNLHAYMVRGWA